MPRRVWLIAILFLWASEALSWAGTPAFNEVIFSCRSGVITAPKARHIPPAPPPAPGKAPKPGWTQSGEEGFIAFDAEDLFPKDEGTLEIKLVVLDTEGLIKLDRLLEALVTLYDQDDTPFFSVGINGHDLTVGSYPLHPMIMENAFGGIGFYYLAELGGPLRDGTQMTITVTWGKPSEDRVYVNGRYIDVKERKGSKNKERPGQPPGFPATAPLNAYLKGFETDRHFYGRGVVGPPKTLTIGRMGKVDAAKPWNMFLPVSVAIRSVRLSNRVEIPK